MKKYPKVPEIQLLDHNPDALLQVQHLVLLGPLRTVDQGRQNRLRCFPFRKVAREDGVLDFFFFCLVISGHTDHVCRANIKWENVDGSTQYLQITPSVHY